MPDSEVTLPRWLSVWYLAVDRAPMTNFKSLNGEILAYGTATFLAVAAIFQWHIDEAVLYAWLLFLAGKIGFAMGGALGKRVTDPAYVEAKARGKTNSGPSVTVAGDATVTANATSEQPVPVVVPVPAVPTGPAFGGKSR